MKQKKSIKLLATVLCLVMCIGLVAACGNDTPAAPATPTTPTAPGGETPAAPGGGNLGDVALVPPPEDATFVEELRVVIDNNQIGVLNPFLPAANNPPTNWVFTMIYDRLVYPSDAGGMNFEPELATSFETDDYQTYRFTLREDVFFHNGDQFTANDVAFTIQQAQASVGSPAFDQWRSVQTVNVISDFEIELTLEDVDVEFLFGLTRPNAGIVNQRAIAADADRGTWVGTGAFRVIDFMTNDFVHVERNEDWWNVDHIPVTQRMHLRFVPEMGTRAMMLQSGEAVISFGTSAEDIPLFEAEPDRFTVHPLTFNDPQGMNFNMLDPLMQDHNFRMAILHAIDRVEIATVAAGRWADGDLQDGNFWGLVQDYRNPNIPFIQQDLDLARSYLEASSYNGEAVEIATAIVTNIRASEVLMAQLQDIGINTTLNQMDVPSLNAHIAGGQGQISVIFTQLGPNAGSIRSAFYPGGAQNRSNFNDQRVSDLINEGSRTFDEARRRAIYYEIQEIVAEIQPVTNLLWRINGIVFDNNVGGFILRSDLHRIDLRQMYMTID
ncbi:MAG: ABC transporter substrate-binding protein [Oscillospiraceae bacterium]|nr:ABC transporter substrate-binding protein [Oscillospiraceae bacterium]